MIKHIYTATKGLLGAYWMGEVDGRLICTHMHKTHSGAIRCAKEWQRFQDSVRNFKKKYHSA